MMEVLVNGTPYTDFLSIEAVVSLNELSNSFNFTTSAVGDFPPIKLDDEIVINVDSEPVLTGAVDEIAGEDAEGAHTITYSGRDRTSDLVDSSIDVINDIRADESLTLKRIIEIVVNHLILDITVDDKLNPKPFNDAEDIVGPEVGDNAFEFIQIYAKKRQALLTSDAAGDIVITQSSPIDSGATVQRIQGSNSNNIISQEWTINGSELFNRYIHRGQLDPRATGNAGETSSETTDDQKGLAIQDAVRISRQSAVFEDESYSSEQLKMRAEWFKQLSIARSTQFSCNVQTHQKPNGGIWEVNTLVQVNSDVADITRKMLINSLTFSEGTGQPTITTLECVERNVYTVDEKLLNQKQAGSQSDAFK